MRKTHQPGTLQTSLDHKVNNQAWYLPRGRRGRRFRMHSTLVCQQEELRALVSSYRDARERTQPQVLYTKGLHFYTSILIMFCQSVTLVL